VPLLRGLRLGWFTLTVSLVAASAALMFLWFARTKEKESRILHQVEAIERSLMAAMEFRLALMAHASDESEVNADSVMGSYMEAVMMVEALRVGGEVEPGIVSAPVTDPQLLAGLDEMAASLSLMRPIARAMLEGGHTPSLGREMDGEFEGFRRTAKGMEGVLLGARAMDLARTKRLFWGILAAWAVAVAASVAGVGLMERRRQSTDKLLHDIKGDWENVFESITDMVTVHDKDFNIIRANKAAREGLGLPAIELAGKLQCYRFYHGTDCPPERCPSCAVAVTGKPSSCEVFEPHLDAYIELRALPRFDIHGNLAGIVHVARDITERKRAEEMLRKTRDDLENLVMGSPIAIVAADLDGVVQLWNPAAEWLFGWGREEAVGRPVPLVREEEKASFLDGLNAVMKGAVGSNEFSLPRKDGSMVDVSIWAAPYTGAGGEVAGVLGFFVDLTEQKRLQRQLLQAQRMEVIGQLTAGVAHEVRNPLNSLMAVTDAFIKEFGEREEFSPYLVHIRNQVVRLSDLTRDLLDLGRPKEQSNFGRVDLVEACLSAIGLWEKTSAFKNKVLFARPAGLAGVPVLADGQRLHQVLLNLFENAAQHSPEGSEIRLVAGMPTGGSVELAVVDMGKGLRAEELARVFEPFFTTRRHGTGLGLSIVKNIVEAHDGSVSISNNEPPPGCTVHLKLPVIKEAA
jgi:PAS domain S-box-containing protein